MKNLDLLFLANNGIMAITSHDLSDSHAYKVYKFKKCFREALEARNAEEKAISEGEGIDNLAQFIADESADKAKKERVIGLLTALNNAEVDAKYFEGVKRLPYAEWHRLQNENRRLAINLGDKTVYLDVFSGRAEELLEGVLWDAPEEE